MAETTEDTEGRGGPAAGGERQSPGRTWVARLAGLVVMVVFGMGIPIALMVEAHSSMRQLSDTFVSLQHYPLLGELKYLQPSLKTADDYRIASQVIAESASQRTMVNKQVMKVAAMHVGFATMSVGLMLVLIGVAEQLSASLKFAGFELNLPQVTTGVLVFLAGSAITSAAALLPNAYQTVGSPSFGGVVATPGAEAGSPGGTVIKPETACGMQYHDDHNGLTKCLKELEDEKSRADKR